MNYAECEHDGGVVTRTTSAMQRPCRSHLGNCSRWCNGTACILNFWYRTSMSAQTNLSIQRGHRHRNDSKQPQRKRKRRKTSRHLEFKCARITISGEKWAEWYAPSTNLTMTWRRSIAFITTSRKHSTIPINSSLHILPFYTIYMCYQGYSNNYSKRMSKIKRNIA